MNRNPRPSSAVVPGPAAATAKSAKAPLRHERVSVAPPQNTRVIARTGSPNPRATIACAASCSRIPPKNSTKMIVASLSASPDSMVGPTICMYCEKKKRAAIRNQDVET